MVNGTLEKKEDCYETTKPGLVFDPISLARLIDPNELNKQTDFLREILNMEKHIQTNPDQREK